MILVYRYRVKSLNGLLNKQSHAVNYVWNFCNDTQKHALKWSKKWPTGFDLNGLTSGSSKELGVHSGTINATCEQYAQSRSQHRLLPNLLLRFGIQHCFCLRWPGLRRGERIGKDCPPLDHRAR